MNDADANSPLRVRCEAVLRGLMTAVWGIRVTGLERVPLSGPLLVACNHVSLMDPPLLGVAIAPSRRPFGLGKKELYENPLIGRFLRGMGSIPLDRRGDVTAMRGALDLLERGGCLMIFPEGTRVGPGERRQPKPGVAFLSARSGAKVVPARVLGTAEFPRRFPLEVRFGTPMEPPPSDDRETGLTYARAVMDAVYKL
ncbi:MAG: 1-acyl-sn-glycerol-3-phosphate acyltransferase [Elusimicrobia bacterium]|nr:1-acyl-sn-glycerol-3-phosphate acyltransferase [Elusimicrobiota bacterium]